jgi:plastocyanin
VTRSRAALLILLVLLGLSVAGCGGDDDEAGTTTEAATEATTEASGSGGTTLNGSVGPGFDISLEGTDGLTAGSYTIVVNDQSASHNFHLTGPGGVDVSTEVSETGEKSLDVELEAGEYTFVCDPHASQMKGSFTVS